MYAVIHTGGKQYRVKEGDVVRVEKVEGEPGQEIEFDKVLMIGTGGDAPLSIGKPFLESARVRATIVSHGRAKKIVVFKFKRRKAYRKKTGHRQDYTGIKILSIHS
jgi:large subunit ribosomal protein L21